MANLARRLKIAAFAADTPPASATGRQASPRRGWQALKNWPRSRRRAALAGAAVVVAAIIFALSDGGLPGPSSGGTGAPSPVAVTPRPLIQRLSLVGTIEPGGVVNLVGPFDGAIKEKLVEYGARVERGQALLVLDTTEIELQMRDAEAVTLKAGQTFDEMNAWGNTPDVVRARHGVLAAQTTVDELTRKEKESKALLARGIIPRMEYDGVAEQLKAQELQLTAARQNLDAVLERGSGEHRRLAALELETARKRLAELKRQMDSGLVEAPVAGLVLRPAGSGGANGSAPAVIEVGSRVSKAQPMFTIADTETLNVVARIDEIDVNRIEEGQPVEVSGDALGPAPLAGRVARISPQAASGDGSSARSAAFEVTVTVGGLTPEQRRRIRVGMSATLAIITYSNPSAVVLPVAAVHSGAEGPYAVVQDPQTGQSRAVPVIVGRAVEDGVEILGGLQQGEMVLVDDATAAGPPAQGPGLPIGPPGLNRL